MPDLDEVIHDIVEHLSHQEDPELIVAEAAAHLSTLGVRLVASDRVWGVPTHQILAHPSPLVRGYFLSVDSRNSFCKDLVYRARHRALKREEEKARRPKTIYDHLLGDDNI